MKKINSINGIKLHYARTNQFPYGSIGTHRNFWIDENFYNKLTVCFDEVFEFCPLKKPKVITCAGIYVNKPNSQHRYGKAFDLDAGFWRNYNFITRNFYEDFELYIGIESFLRKHFGIVLSYFYNNAHKDHFHINSGANMGFDKRQRSKVLYVQMSLKYIYKYDILIDGQYGPQTSSAFRHILKKLNINGYLTIQKWFVFLTKTGLISFKLFKTKNSPRRILDNIHSTINELNISSDERFKLISSLNELEENVEISELIESLDDNDNLENLITSVNTDIT